MTLQQIKYVIAIADSGSLNEAAKRLFVSQPSLSCTVKDLEEEVGVEIFHRSNHGVRVTPEGDEFLSYARQVADQYQLLEGKYINKKLKHRFGVSSQHYAFVVQAFSEVVRQVGIDKYEFSLYETRTYDILENVRSHKSELGVIYLNDFNEKVIKRLLHEDNLEFCELFICNTFVYLGVRHPLASRTQISMADLDEYPCLTFEQGMNNSFYLAEEVMSTYDYKRTVKTSDRATMLNLMITLDGYTLCSGIICEELNGSGFKAIPLQSGGTMRIGYIHQENSAISKLGELFIKEMRLHMWKIQKGQGLSGQ